ALALGSPLVIVPAAAGVMSSAGFLTAPLAFDFVRSSRSVLDALRWEDAAALFAEMEREGAALLADSGVAPQDVSHARFADMRYVGQGFEVRVPASVEADAWPGGLLAAFEQTYLQLYGRRGPDVPVEVINWRVVSSGPRPGLRLRPHTPPSDVPSAKGQRQAYFPSAGGFVATPVYERSALRAGERIAAPAIVEERESTLVLPPGAACTVAPDLSLVVDLRPEDPS
ncbi:MAG: hypothetical protein WBC33_08820, partial [Conexibacter sp.]